MFNIQGRRSVNLKSYTDNYAECAECRTKTIRFTVFREYFHFWFLPLFPSDIKEVSGVCEKCGMGNANPVKEEYLRKTRTPLYFYSGMLLFAALILMLIIFGIRQYHEESAWIKDPAVGDVYLIKGQGGKREYYYWAKVKEIRGADVYAIKSALWYRDYRTEMDPLDYFDRNKRTRFKKDDLLEMYDNGEILSIKRNYDSGSRFRVEHK